MLAIDINNFPKELLLNCFSNLDHKNLGICAQVSKKWQRVAEDNTLWNKLFSGIPQGSMASVKKAIAFNRHNFIYSLDEIVLRAWSFVSKLPKNLNAAMEMICFFPANPEAEFKMRVSNPSNQNQSLIQKVYYFVAKENSLARKESETSSSSFTINTGSHPIQIDLSIKLDSFFKRYNLMDGIKNCIKSLFPTKASCVIS